jgi:hypothetical protein
MFAMLFMHGIFFVVFDNLFYFCNMVVALRMESVPWLSYLNCDDVGTYVLN